jgi:hypothetical protein
MNSGFLASLAPSVAFGNFTGDRQMIEYTGAGDGARLMMLLLHDDGKPQYACGPAQGLSNTKFGIFNQALYDEAKKKGLHQKIGRAVRTNY